MDCEHSHHHHAPQQMLSGPSTHIQSRTALVQQGCVCLNPPWCHHVFKYTPNQSTELLQHAVGYHTGLTDLWVGSPLLHHVANGHSACALPRLHNMCDLQKSMNWRCGWAQPTGHLSSAKKSNTLLRKQPTCASHRVQPSQADCALLL